MQLVTLANEKTSLLELWEERRIMYEQCMDLQLFYRDTEQADAWMTKQEVNTRHPFHLTCICYVVYCVRNIMRCCTKHLVIIVNKFLLLDLIAKNFR